MFKLVNGPEQTGDYAFSGELIVSEKSSNMLSKEELNGIVQTVKEYTKDQLRPQNLLFEDDVTGDHVFVDDNISLKEMEELRIKKPNSYFLNYFTIMYEGELPF